MSTRIRTAVLALLSAGVLSAVPGAMAADLPKSTIKALEKIKFSTDILAGIDEELAMPQEWIDGAKKEGELKIMGSWDPRQFREMSAPFRERYPFVKLGYNRGGRVERSFKVLIALKQGRYLAHIITSPGGEWVDFKDDGELMDLSILPNFKNLPEENRERTGLWIGEKMAFRCMAYNTSLIKESDLPKTWDDLVTNPVWRNGNLAMTDRPNLWLSMLWLHNGPDWTIGFMEKMFRDVKPQLRKEGSSASVGLTVAGETPAVIGAAEYRVKEYALKGAPVSWHCPEPVPVAISQLIMLKRTPARHSGLMFLNWFLSKEGQIAQYSGDFSTPVHKDFYNDPRFYPYPDKVIGKPHAFRDEEKLRTEYPKLVAAYTPLWQGAGGEVENEPIVGEFAGAPDNRAISIKLRTGVQSVKISPTRTEILLDKQKADLSALKTGLICEVTFMTIADEAAKVACEN